jgi:hypothetical protein
MKDKRVLLIVAALVVLLIIGGGVTVVALKLSASEEKKLAGLQPHVRRKVEELLRRMAARGHRVLVGSTLRSDAEQKAIVERGNSATSNSWHLVGRAVDLYPYGPDGKPDMDGRHVSLYRALHEESAKLGFQNLAFNDDGSIRYITTSKGKVWDAGHVELRESLTFAQAVDEYRKSKGVA